MKLNPTAIIVAALGMVTLFVLAKLHLTDAAIVAGVVAIGGASMTERAVRKLTPREMPTLAPPPRDTPDPDREDTPITVVGTPGAKKDPPS